MKGKRKTSHPLVWIPFPDQHDSRWCLDVYISCWCGDVMCSRYFAIPCTTWHIYIYAIMLDIFDQKYKQTKKPRYTNITVYHLNYKLDCKRNRKSKIVNRNQLMKWALAHLAHCWDGRLCCMWVLLVLFCSVLIGQGQHEGQRWKCVICEGHGGQQSLYEDRQPRKRYLTQMQIALGAESGRQGLDRSKACLHKGDVMFWNWLSQCCGFVKKSERACRSGRAFCNRSTWKETQFVHFQDKMWGEL